MTTLLLVPSSLVAPLKFDQLVVATLGFCCNRNPVEADGQEMITLFAAVCRIVKGGAPGVWITLIRLQNPPVTEYCAPSIVPPASAWPMVPLTANCPLLLVPPPP